jgi:hypothetical protein
LNYQKREIVDTFDQLLDTKTDLLVDGTLFCTNDLPLTNVDFKLFQRDLYTRPVILKNFTLDENSTQTFVSCNVIYDKCESVLKPLFIFPNKKLKNTAKKHFLLLQTHKDTFIISNFGANRNWLRYSILLQ